MNWVLFIILFILSLYLLCLYKKEKNKNIEIEKINDKTREENKKINNENEQALKDKETINEFIKQKQEELKNIQDTISNAEQISTKAFENFIIVLNEEYDKKEKEYNKAVELLNKSYKEVQENILKQIEEIKKDLNKIAATRAAAIQAQLKEAEIKNKEIFYSLSIDDMDKREVKVLHSIESELRDPRPIRMIIWQTYYSKKANELAARVLGTNDICGIYKITNKINGLCYIGQSKNVRERFREHIKCGLGIDTPSNNKLYPAMLSQGIDAFTFELLEECAPMDLNEKESFYINLYNSYDFGYNSNRGVIKNS